MHPFILSANILENYDSLAATDTDDGYDVLNVLDRRPYTWWQAGNVTTRTKYIEYWRDLAASADTIGIVGHNLSSAGASIALEHSSDGMTWTTAVTGFAPGSDKAILKTFSSTSRKYWRLKIYRDGSDFSYKPRLAVVVIGSRLEFPTPPDSPFAPNPEEIVATSNKGRTGHHLGTVIGFYAVRITAKFAQLSTSWVASTLYPWWRDYGRRLLPFFWAWNLTAAPDSVHYLKLTDNSKFQDPRSRAGFVDAVTLEMEGTGE
jgi:hypothetical protein